MTALCGKVRRLKWDEGTIVMHEPDRSPVLVAQAPPQWKASTRLRFHSSAFTWGPRRQVTYSWHRVDALIDGIFAIAATLLVLEIKRPHVAQGDLGRALLEQGPEYLVYALGFLQIAGGWLVLRRFSSWCTAIDHYGTILLLLDVAIYSLTPFTAAVLASAVSDNQDFASAVRLMAAVTFAAMVAFSSTVVYLVRRDLFRSDLDRATFETGFAISMSTPLWPVAAYCLSYIAPGLGLSALVAFFLLTLLPL